MFFFISFVCAKGPFFTAIVIQSYKINIINNSNILSLATVCRNLARSFCRVKNNVFFLFSPEYILFKKRGLVVHLLFTGYDIKMTNADYEDNNSLL